MRNVFVGIDVSKLKVDACILLLTSERGIEKAGVTEVENCRQGFRCMCTTIKKLTGCKDSKRMLFCCETTGGYDYKLCEYLHEKGYFIWRESALQIARSSGFHRGKDDREDALKIADYAYRFADRAECYRPEREEIRQLKEYINCRALLVKQRADWKNKTISKNDTETHKNKRKSNPLLTTTFRRVINGFDKEIAKIDKTILNLIANDEELLRTYSCIITFKGIGHVNAAALLAYTDNFRRFRTSREFAAFVGIAPYRIRSGSSIDRPAFTKCYSNKRLKAYLTQAAQSAIIHNGIMKEYYHRMRGNGKPHKVALNNVRNKIINTIFSMVKNEKDFTPEHEFRRQSYKEQGQYINYKSA